MIEIIDLCKVFGESDESKFYANKDINLKINDNELLVILGPSGSGKSTFMNLLSTLEKPTSGRILYDGKDISKLKGSKLTKFRKEEIGFIFQQYHLVPMLTVYENIEITAKLANKDKNFINNLIEEVGLKGKENKYPFQLSGGEQQRVAIARAIAKTPKVLFCDEPTGALDEENSKKILKLICKVQKEYGITIIMVTHNPLFADLADRVIQMNSSRIISDKLNKIKKDVDELEWNS